MRSLANHTRGNMTPRRLVFHTLKTICYPFFKRNLEAVRGLEHLPTTGGYLIAANHVDWLDGFYVATAVGLAKKIPVHFLTASNNYWWTTMAVQVPRQRGEIVDTATQALQAGKVVCNFVEGQRNADATLLPGKTGTVRMAIAAGVPVVPLGITCSSERTVAQSFWNVVLKRRGVQLSFGAPLTFPNSSQAMTKEHLTLETQRLMEAIAPLAGKHV